jgi:hypothetical protein
VFQLIVLQLKTKLIPAFEHLHGPGFQALFIVDHSQGHAAYAPDALLVSRMNTKPGGKQARMRDGWYLKAGEKVVQSMIFPSNHREYPDQPKGIKVVLLERGFEVRKLRGKCKGSCKDPDAVACCCKRILELQPDFKGQKSLVEEIIHATGHLCIFLPKFHCELNFIEFFWGVVKKYLREHSDFTFDTLKENLPKALASVPLATIWQWEHRMYRWMDAYCAGMGTQDAQLHVRKFGSRQYKSHRRIFDRPVGSHFDGKSQFGRTEILLLTQF